MKRYISSSTKYTSLEDLKELLEQQGFYRGYMWNKNYDDRPATLEIPLQFVAGPATLLVENATNYQILFNGTVLSKGFLSWLFRPYMKDNIIYNKICVAAPSRIMKASDPEAAERKLTENRLKEIKQMSISQMLEYINGVRDIDDEVAEDAMRQLRYRIPDDDLVTLTNGHWKMEVIDSKAENWASIGMQAYGYHYTTTVQLETSKDTYTVDVKRTEGWHTE